jgi:hypothetical protein
LRILTERSNRGNRFQLPTSGSRNVRSNWIFWALSNKMNEQAQLESQMENQPQGVVYQSKADARCNYNMTFLAKYWSEIIGECTARLKFFHDRLNYNASCFRAQD